MKQDVQRTFVICGSWRGEGNRATRAPKLERDGCG